MTDNHEDYKRKVRRKFRPEIKRLIRAVGFTTKNVRVGIDESCDPEVGFFVRVVGQDTPENRRKVEDALNDFAYNITFVKA